MQPLSALRQGFRQRRRAALLSRGGCRICDRSQEQPKAKVECDTAQPPLPGSAQHEPAPGAQSCLLSDRAGLLPPPSSCRAHRHRAASLTSLATPGRGHISPQEMSTCISLWRHPRGAMEDAQVGSVSARRQSRGWLRRAEAALLSPDVWSAAEGSWAAWPPRTLLNKWFGSAPCGDGSFGQAGKKMVNPSAQVPREPWGVGRALPTPGHGPG